MTFLKLERSLAGLQAGMFGGIALVGVMAFVSALDRRSPWSYGNVLGSHFYGMRAIGAAPGWPTVAGIALQLLIAACAGAVFGALFGGVRGSVRLAVLGLLWGVLVFYFSERYYAMTTPIVIAYLHRNAAIVAHMIYGVCLAATSRIGAAPRTAVMRPTTAELRVRDIPQNGAPVLETSPEDAGSAGQERTV